MTKSWWEDLPAEFEECGSDCGRRRKHTLRHPGCTQGVRPEPTLGFWRTFRAEDGDLSIGQAEIPLAAVLPWAAYLTTDQRWQMLEEAADAEDPAAVIGQWRRIAEAYDGGAEWARLVAADEGKTVVPSAHFDGLVASLDGPAVPNEPTRDALARLDSIVERRAGGHSYLSTSCRHGDMVLPDGRTGHEYCQGDTGLSGAKVSSVCKFCGAFCLCPCHGADMERGTHG